MIHKVAISPVKKKNSVTQAEVVATCGCQGEPTPLIENESQNVSHIPAYRPEYISGETASLDIKRDSTIREDCRVEHYESPAFLTMKKKAMHCELDEPGYDIPFPRNTQKKNVVQRLLACFRTPSIYSPPRVTSHRPRPPSSGLVPPMLTLENEVAPLKSSLSEYIQDDYSDKLLSREESFESLVAEVSDAGDTPEVQRNMAMTKQDEMAESVAPTNVQQSVVVSKLHNVHRGTDYTSRLLKQTNIGHDVRKCPSPENRSRTASPTKSARNPPRMTKATLARNEANRRKIKEMNMMESAHFDAMPTAIKRASVHVPDRKALVPKSRQSLATFDTAKQRYGDHTAVNVSLCKDRLDNAETLVVADSTVSDKNHMMSLSFSNDPFYKELARIDRSLTQDDLEKLREALLITE